MSFTVIHEEAGVVHAVYEGDMDMPGLLAMIQTTADLIKEHGCRLVLSDYRQAVLKVSIADLYELPKLILKRGREMGISAYRLKRALIVPSRVYKTFLFFETVSINNMQNVRIFTEEAQAREWLLADDP